MTFEEFFKKKRIDLDALQKNELVLFSEFKAHYEQMGAKSFDHTKKYWFNKVRRQFPLTAEVKTEKLKIENQLAEQTVTEALMEEGMSPAPKLGFVPKFKAANLGRPADEPQPEKAELPLTEKSETPPAPKLGFVPKFKAANLPKQVAEEKPDAIEPETPPAPKLGFKPKFKAVNAPQPATEEKREIPEPETPPAPKLGFKPKFKAVNMPLPATEEKPEVTETAKEAPANTSAEPNVPQPYKPRFNIKNIPPKATE